MSEYAQYLVRDQQGNSFGPADMQMLRQWVKEGRIVAGMSISLRDSGQWSDAAVHPITSDLVQARLREEQAPADNPPPSTIAISSLTSPAPFSRPVASSPRPIETVADYDSGVRPAGIGIPPRQNAAGVVSFITGLVSFGALFGTCVPPILCVALPMGFICSLIAVSGGIVAIFQIRAEPGVYTGMAFPIMGLVFGGLALAIDLIVIILAVGFAMHR